jgi:lipopolysaccharide transport system ATP-binding protein
MVSTDSEESNNFAIRVRGLNKCYHIYDSPNDRLKQFVIPRLSSLVGLSSKQYFREFSALKDVSFEVKKGETIGIIGRNGAGKSTLLQIICNTLSPTSGTLEVNGRIAALLELGSGFNPEFTGRENVYMNAAVLGLNKNEVDERFDSIVDFADIGDFIEQPIKTYSSGMVVRLAFAVIAHVDADILVVDEALSVGDAYFVQKCMRFLRSFMERGTLLFCSHDTGAVVNLCSKAVLLKQGKVAAIGTPKEVTEDYLADLCDISNVKSENDSVEKKDNSKPIQEQQEYRDMREGMINESHLRNDIEIFKFNPNQPGFGTGSAKIISVTLYDGMGAPLSWVIGGEDVILAVRCNVKKDLVSPIVGFQFKDRLGQVVFADNTYLAYKFNSPVVHAGSDIIAKFYFRLPVLPYGDYSIAAAIAEGSQDNHIQHHWLHDALIVRVHASSVCFGLIGIPMRKITMEIE